MPVALQAQSTFTFGSANQPRQVYPVGGAPMQQGYAPMGMMPRQQAYAPMPGAPMGGRGSGGSGIPIGPIIGLVSGLIQSAVMADKQDRMQRQAFQREQQDSTSIYDKYTTCNGSSASTTPYKKAIKNEVTADNATYDRSVALRREPLLTGTRITHNTVKSPYSNYNIDTSSGATLPGHIVTDHSVAPKKNFLIPPEIPFSATED